MVITCEYCGTGITLGNQGWKDIQKHTMLPLNFTKDKVAAAIHDMMDKGIFKHHVQEESTLEEMTATYIPYWIIPVSARTTIVAVDEMQQLGQTATQAALMGIVLGGLGGGRGGGFGGGGGGRRRSFDMTSLLGSVGRHETRGRSGRPARDDDVRDGNGDGRRGARKTFQLDQNYNFPVVAMNDLTEYQPHDYTFALSQRVLFDVSKIDKSMKVLNGDISEDVAKAQAKTLVDQLQSQEGPRAAPHDSADQHGHGRLGRGAAPRPGVVHALRPQGEEDSLRHGRELRGRRSTASGSRSASPLFFAFTRTMPATTRRPAPG